MCGLMPLGPGESYDLSRYPNLARYISPKAIGTTPTTTQPTATISTDSYDSFQEAPSQTRQEKANDNTNTDNPSNHQSAQPQDHRPPTTKQAKTHKYNPNAVPFEPAKSYNSGNDIATPETTSISPPISAAEVFSGGDWRWCFACHSNKICVARGRCIVKGAKVKVVF
ncbi:hypothetical protein Q7P37_010554 [Cladosporium fusiforme]